jgi:hypothetical protein
VAVFDYFFNSNSPISPEDPTPPAVNVSIVGSGVVGRSPEKDSYTCGEQVTLTATPGVGSVFANWSGDITGTNPVQTVTVNGVRNVVATFVPVGQSMFKQYLPVIRR